MKKIQETKKILIDLRDTLIEEKAKYSVADNQKISIGLEKLIEKTQEVIELCDKELSELKKTKK